LVNLISKELFVTQLFSSLPFPSRPIQSKAQLEKRQKQPHSVTFSGLTQDRFTPLAKVTANQFRPRFGGMYKLTDHPEAGPEFKESTYNRENAILNTDSGMDYGLTKTHQKTFQKNIRLSNEAVEKIQHLKKEIEKIQEEVQTDSTKVLELLNLKLLKAQAEQERDEAHTNLADLEEKCISKGKVFIPLTNPHYPAR
jgi:hypothetical protein